MSLTFFKYEHHQSGHFDSVRSDVRPPAELPVAENWLTKEQTAQVRADVKAKVGSVELTTVEDIFSKFGL